LSEQTKVIHAPYTAEELLATGWVHRVRKAVLDNGNAIFIGAGCTIDAQCINEPDKHLAIMLPNGGTKLLNLAECLQVAAWITGEQPIPEPVKEA
jgi:hypothetical protein